MALDPFTDEQARALVNLEQRYQVWMAADADAAGAILREADRRGLPEKRLRVVGANAMPACALEAGGFIRDAPGETDDLVIA